MKPTPDAVQFFIDSDYKQQAQDILNKWQEYTGFELEEDNVVKLIARDVNNYAEIIQKGDNDYEVNFKGGELTRGEHIFGWNKEKNKFEYSFKDSLKNNSMAVVSEALLKFLLFDIPIEGTINNCNDIFKFQQISHLGGSYEKCVQESPNGDIELQRNNRIYAGLKPSGNIIKVKPNGRRDSLANCPPNPIVDNANKCTIGDINKEWYIEFATRKANDFLGVKRLEDYKKDELSELASSYNIEIDKKIKKSELIKLIKDYKQKEKVNEGESKMTKTELEEENKVLKDKLEHSVTQNENLMNKIKNKDNNEVNMNQEMELEKKLYTKIVEFRKKMREREFVMDEELPSNLGGGEYASIGQLYNAVQDICLEVGLDFSFETNKLLRFDIDCTKPSGKLPIHIATVESVVTLTDIDTGFFKLYTVISQGSDTMDKAVSGASTLGFRNWLNKNFTPKTNIGEDIDDGDKSTPPKTPVYIPEEKKEEIKKEVVMQEQKVESDDEDCKLVCDNIMKIRKLMNDDTYGQKALDDILSGNSNAIQIEQMIQLTNNRLEELENA